MVKVKNLLIFILTLVIGAFLIGCGESSTGYYDKVTKSLKLSKSFEGKSFLLDGVGLATVNAHTDGDTTRFRLADGNIIIIRYFEIDTPESTSSVEKWGKAASNFTKKTLDNAYQIVLESSTGSRPVHDSYGSRWLGYVWYRNSESENFKCLNLELVENGFSYNKGIETDDYPYYSYFNKAENFAKSKKLHLHSDEDDPLYNTDPVDMTLKEFYENTDKYYSFDTNSGAKVRLTACITSLYKSPSGTFNFTATEIDPATGEKHSIMIYAGYVSSSASDMKIGHLYKFLGNIEYYNGQFQLSNILYDTIFPDAAGFSKAIQKGYYLTFNSDISFISQYSQTLYGDVTVRDANVIDGTLLIDAEAYQAKSLEGDGSTKYADTPTQFTIEVYVGENYNEEIGQGSTISFGGYQFVAASGNITVFDYSTIQIK